MTRILADLPDEDIAWLDLCAEREGKSRAAVLRDAVARYKAEPGEGDMDWIDAGFSLWAGRGIAADPAGDERRRRAEWTRPWDDDYEMVRAESPDMFDAEDDRLRAVHLAMLAGRDVGAAARKSGGA